MYTYYVAHTYVRTYTPLQCPCSVSATDNIQQSPLSPISEQREEVGVDFNAEVEGHTDVANTVELPARYSSYKRAMAKSLLPRSLPEIPAAVGYTASGDQLTPRTKAKANWKKALKVK